MPDYAGMPIRKISAMLLSEMFQTPCGNGYDRPEDAQLFERGVVALQPVLGAGFPEERRQTHVRTLSGDG